MKFFRESKGQSIVEFVLLLGFAASISYYAIESGLLDSVASLYSPAAKVLRAVDHYRSYNIPVAIAQIEEIQSNGHYNQGNSGANQMNYKRGVIRSGWVDKFEDDANRSEVKNLRDEIGASQWSYLNGIGNAYKPTPSSNGYYRGDVGLYWTTDTLKMSMLTSQSTAESSNYSKELVLQYFYSTITGKYYVIKNYAWVNQGDVDNHIALSGFHQQYNKPAGYFAEGCVNGFDTLADAKELFEQIRKVNGYSVVFYPGSFNLENDVYAGDYLISGDKFVYTGH